ncbi:unnamed protein product [Periconia digitata]|uniref:SH3 domain-containing protein n=1 Tax=Periconia digitata TaxID=1303443 RepID=A0A9W4UVZ7_9PLEO|nr:unnamed protein product [Periconia digitata]
MTPKTIDLPEALAQLEPLSPDQYFTAFGPAGQQFLGTPNGYYATSVPACVLEDLLSGRVRKVLWASFGHVDKSYFFLYEKKDGSCEFRGGKKLPFNLDQFFRHVSTTFHKLAAQLRVQLGDNGSYVAWSGSFWICDGLPKEMFRTLKTLSSLNELDETVTGAAGIFGPGDVKNVTWHKSGSFFIEGVEPSKSQWFFQAGALEKGWKMLWGNSKELLESIAHVSIGPHSPTGGSFLIVKTKQADEEPDLVLRLEPDEMFSRLEGQEIPGLTNAHRHVAKEKQPGANSTGEASTRQAMNVADRTDTKEGDPQWARAKSNKRTHAKDRWELAMAGGERVQVLQNVGNGWLLVQNSEGVRGWAHENSITLEEKKVDAREAYTRWKTTTTLLMGAGAGAIRAFPDPKKYMDTCRNERCELAKGGELGICAHDLKKLLSGSDAFSFEFLKTERLKWHPDSFGRYCHPDHREELKAKSQALFVLFGVLMDTWKMIEEIRVHVSSNMKNTINAVLGIQN